MFCYPRHACFAASSHINNVACTATPSIQFCTNFATVILLHHAISQKVGYYSRGLLTDRLLNKSTTGQPGLHPPSYLPLLRADRVFEFDSWEHLQEDDAHAPQVHGGRAARVSLHLHAGLGEAVLKLSLWGAIPVCLYVLHILGVTGDMTQISFPDMSRGTIYITIGVQLSSNLVIEYFVENFND